MPSAEPAKPDLEHARICQWLGLAGGRYEPIERSTTIDLGAADLARPIDWP